MKVLVYYKISPGGLELLEGAGLEPVVSGGEISWVHDNWAALEKIDAAVRRDITVMIGSPMPIDEKLIQLLPNLKWIHSTHAGLSGDSELNWGVVDKYGIAITTSKIHFRAISEMALAMILSLYKKLPEFTRNKDRHIYSKAPHANMLFGQTALIVGTGHIGREIGRKLKAGFDTELLGINSDGHEVEYFNETYTMENLDSLLTRADIVVLSCALTPETKNLIDQKRLAFMKNSAILINIARGQIVVQKDLVDALKGNIIAGAGLDVFETEPIEESDPIWDLENVIITPHISGLFRGYDESVIHLFLSNLSYFEKGIMEQSNDYANVKRY